MRDFSKAVRARLLPVGFIFVFFGLLLSLFNLQVFRYGTLSVRAQKVYSGVQAILPIRGAIEMRDRDGNDYSLAVSDHVFNVYWNAKQGDPDDIDKVSEIVPLLKPKESILAAAAKGQSYILIAKRISLERAKAVNKAKIKVDLEEEIIRTYPYKNFASRALGFALVQDQKEVGQYGLEAFYDDFLNGAGGARDRTIVLQNPADGATLYTSLDVNLQKKAEEVMRKGIEEFKADTGLAVVMDAKTGEILAVADEPSYDPNSFNKVSDYEVFRSSLVEPYEVGSVMKAFTFSAGLDRGVFKPQDTYQDVGTVFADTRPIQNYDKKAHGTITLLYALEHSYNLGAIAVLNKLGFDSFLQYVQAFGFGKRTGIDIPYENAGNIGNLTQPLRKTSHFYTASFGQGITMTPAQILAAFSAFTNNGEMIEPHLVRSIKTVDGETRAIGRTVIGRPIGSSTVPVINAMLEDVILKGSGKHANMKSFRVAGKTGSAQIPEKGGYSPDKVINTFVGFFPVSNPRLIILIKLDNPQYEGLHWSELTAVPLWREIADYAAQYLYIAPDKY